MTLSIPSKSTLNTCNPKKNKIEHTDASPQKIKKLDHGDSSKNTILNKIASIVSTSSNLPTFCKENPIGPKPSKAPFPQNLKIQIPIDNESRLNINIQPRFEKVHILIQSKGYFYQKEECYKLGEGAFSSVWNGVDYDGKSWAIKEINEEVLNSHDVEKKQIIYDPFKGDHLGLITQGPRVQTLKEAIYVKNGKITEPPKQGSVLVATIAPIIKDAENLDSFLEKNTLTQNQAVFLALDIAKGIKELIDSRIIHGDLHLGNILISKTTGNITIIDFTLAHIMGKSPRIRESFCGWKRVIAPERFISSGLSQKYPEKQDVWAFGSILWSISSELKGEVICIDNFNSENLKLRFPIFEHLILNTVKKNPKERYSIYQVLEELENMVVDIFLAE